MSVCLCLSPSESISEFLSLHYIRIKYIFLYEIHWFHYINKSVVNSGEARNLRVGEHKLKSLRICQ